VREASQRTQLHRLGGAQRPTGGVQNQLPGPELGQGLRFADRAQAGGLRIGLGWVGLDWIG